MNILYTLNDKFAPQVGAAITSVCENNKDVKDINFYLITLNFSKGNISKMKKLVKTYNRNIYFYELDDINKYFTFQFDTQGWNKVILARLLVDKILPSDVDKVLYMDGDTIVRGSLSSLYETNIGSKILGMSIEPTIEKNRIASLELGDHPYCNSGVLLIDLKKWRKKKIGEKIIEYYREKKGNLFAADQDAINAVLKNDIYIISPRYNYYNIFDQYSYNFLKRNMKPLEYDKYITKEDMIESKKNPVIIHYLGEERPWREGNTHKYRNDYKHYLSLTPWKDTEDEKGWRLYFICWKIFNTITKPFPGLRLSLINKLIPAFMKYRKNKLKKAK